MTPSTVNSIKTIAQEKYAAALKWTRANPPIVDSSATPEERAANMAADDVMYKLGMHEYAEFQNQIGNQDVATWLRNS